MKDTLNQWKDEALTEETAWTLVTLLAAIAGAALARNALKLGWKKTTGKEPPLDPAASEVTWIDALAWGIVTGVIAGIARAVSRRGATGLKRYWT